MPGGKGILTWTGTYRIFIYLFFPIRKYSMFFFKKWKYAEYQRESGSSKQKLFCISDFCLAFPRDNLVFTEFATVAMFMVTSHLLCCDFGSPKNSS